MRFNSAFRCEERFLKVLVRIRLHHAGCETAVCPIEKSYVRYYRGSHIGFYIGSYIGSCVRSYVRSYVGIWHKNSHKILHKILYEILHGEKWVANLNIWNVNLIIFEF